MLTRIFTLLLVCAALLASQPALADGATPIRPGVTYDGGVRLASAEAGVSFTLPAGFQGGLPQGSSFFMMGAASSAGRILMTADAFTVAEASATMAQPIDLGDGVVLMPQAAPTTEGRRVHGRYAVQGAPQALVAEVESLVGPHGVGVAIIAVAPEGEMEGLRKVLAAVRGSLRFSAPPAPSVPDAAPSGQGGGQPQLSAVRLLRFYSGSGYSEKTVLHLCSNGSFRRNFDASSVSGLGTGVATDGSAGRYSVRGNQLVLEYHDGSRAVHQVALQDDKLMLDGQRWLREYQDCF